MITRRTLEEFINIITGGEPQEQGFVTTQARIDPQWNGTLRPTVIFDGETSVGSKSYTYLSSYHPVPGDQVALVKLGHSWVILGKIVNS